MTRTATSRAADMPPANGAAEKATIAAASPARGGPQTIRQASETHPGSAEGTAEFGRLFVGLLGEQVRHNAQAAAALGRAASWAEVVRVQGGLVSASLARLHQLNGCYFEAVQAVTRAAASTAGKPDGRSA